VNKEKRQIKWLCSLQLTDRWILTRTSGLKLQEERPKGMTLYKMVWQEEDLPRN
jgi:hypothetical protein